MIAPLALHRRCGYMTAKIDETRRRDAGIRQTGDEAMSENFNMSMRKFLKQVGVTSQQAIEEAMRKAGDTAGRKFEAKMVLTIDGLDLEHVVKGEIEGQG